LLTGRTVDAAGSVIFRTSGKGCGRCEAAYKLSSFHWESVDGCLVASLLCARYEANKNGGENKLKKNPTNSHQNVFNSLFLPRCCEKTPFFDQRASLQGPASGKQTLVAIPGPKGGFFFQLSFPPAGKPSLPFPIPSCGLSFCVMHR
jgi:hypothetical protein